ncbi:secretory phospholipase A2 receptor-like [Kryptolebias marmoratus]|uniref:secretory phospholipase A2 receptor-like n=1 Tax=Kryptolebias marmoratus TaxID=37003 RepID=UPI0007F89328|nr:secretory phospholipase A2 receptor-like [Kryptolebias marmoratus]
MEKIIFRVIIITSACCFSAKHVFHDWKKMSWSDARKHCREHHNDLSRISNELEEMLFRKSGSTDKEGWIGIFWDNSLKKWKWSGGENITYHKNLKSEDVGNQSSHTADNVYWTNDEWKWKNGEEKHDFFCFDLTVVQEEKTWEEALEHCRKNNDNLTSLLSENDNLLAANEINQTSVTERVWIGLRYLRDKWLWVNGDPLRYDAWSQGGDQDHQCPMKRGCGALTKEGLWESWDCQEKLSFICG